jgi:hypothetical protein
MNRKASSFLAAIVLTCIPAVSRAQDFFADVVYVAPGKPAAAAAAVPLHEPSKLYVSNHKMRLETRGLTGTILLVDSDANATVALFPAQKAYQPLSSAPSEYFRVDDPENACSDWQKASERKIACEKIGHETVDGHDTVKYKNKGATLAAPLAAVWIDPTLKFVVKWEDATTGAELRNITKQEKLSTALFEVPPGFGILKPKKKQPKSGAGAK